MRTETTRALGTMMLLAALLAADAGAAGAQGNGGGRSALVAQISDGEKTPAPDRADVNAPKEEPDKATTKSPSLLKRMFKDVRAGSCKTQAAPSAPTTSAVPRGEAALSVCRS